MRHHGHQLAIAGVTLAALGFVLSAPAPATAASRAPSATTGAATAVTPRSAVLNATINPNGLGTTFAFQYGSTNNYGSHTSTQWVGSGSAAVPVAMTIYGLTPGNTYHFRVVATNPLGTVAGTDMTFVATPEAPIVALGKPSLVNESSVTLTGSVNPNARATTVTFQYGTSPSYGLQSAPVSIGSGTAAKSVTASLTGLASGTPYYYRLVAISSAGTSVSPGAIVVTTGSALAPGGPAPVVSLGGAVKITSSSVQLNGAINPEGDPTSWHFEYGLSASYGLETTPAAMAGLGIRPIDATIVGLRAETTYHYRLVANSANGLYVGPDGTFTTRAAPPAPARDLTLATQQARSRGGVRVTVSGRLVLPRGIGSDGYAGVVSVAFQRHDPLGPTFMRVRAPLRADGTYRVTTWFSSGHLHGHDHFGVTVRFQGNARVLATTRQTISHVLGMPVTR